MRMPAVATVASGGLFRHHGCGRAGPIPPPHREWAARASMLVGRALLACPVSLPQARRHPGRPHPGWNHSEQTAGAVTAADPDDPCAKSAAAQPRRLVPDPVRNREAPGVSPGLAFPQMAGIVPSRDTGREPGNACEQFHDRVRRLHR